MNAKHENLKIKTDKVTEVKLERDINLYKESYRPYIASSYIM
jgi:hypothetical protein